MDDVLAEIEDRMLDLEPTSSPGFPMRFTLNSNSDLMRDQAQTQCVKDRVFQRLFLIMSGKVKEVKTDADWFLLGLRDPDRAFGKNQAHTLKKTDVRIIAAQALADQLLCRIFFNEYTEAEMRSFPDLPNKKGISFAEKGSTKIYTQYRATVRKHGCAIASDVEGWEKKVSREIVEVAADAISATCNNHSAAASLAIEWWKESLLNNPYYIDDGEIVSFDDSTVMRSGNYLTTSANGIMRYALAVAAGAEEAWTMGDDCVEWWARLLGETDEELKARVIAKYATMNVKIRSVEILGDTRLTFCSHDYVGASRLTADGLAVETAVSYLCDPGRMIYELVHKPAAGLRGITESDVLNYLVEVQYHPDKAMVARLKLQLQLQFNENPDNALHPWKTNLGIRGG